MPDSLHLFSLFLNVLTVGDSTASSGRLLQGSCYDSLTIEFLPLSKRDLGFTNL